MNASVMLAIACAAFVAAIPLPFAQPLDNEYHPPTVSSTDLE